MKKIAILGSTGSVGRSTLKVISENREKFTVEALSAKSNIDLLEKQANEFSPKIIAVYDDEKAILLRKRLPNIKVVSGLGGLNEIATYNDVDFVMSSISGSIGLIPTIEAIKAKKTIGLANKEVMVSAGDLVNKLLKENKVDLIPVDSEHSAIFQCLKNEDVKNVERIILTASGGPFWNYPIDRLEKITLEEALCHPTYSMGSKITIDSSTLMNKGLEVIEAYHLFKIEKEKIDIVIHPQSIIHSLVEFIDGSMLSQMAEPNMQIPIHYALCYPKREKGNIARFDFTKNSTLSFYPPDKEKFLCLKIALQALKEGRSLPCFMNAANEVLVERFLKQEISWIDISKKLKKLISFHSPQNMLDLDTVLEVDKQAREQAKVL